MRWVILVIGLVFTHISYGLETTIRILGVYPSHQSLAQADMTAHLQMIASAWNNSNLPTYSGVTVQLLNNAVAVPINYPWVESTTFATVEEVYTQPQQATFAAMRAAWQADVIVLYINATSGGCGASSTYWHDANGAFVPGGNGLDLRFRNSAYISVAIPQCHELVSPHEIGHLLGGGHYLTPGLYQDSRASTHTVGLPYPPYTLVYGSIMSDPEDGILLRAYYYSQDFPGHGDANHNNVRAISTTASSVANYYEYPSVPPVLNPPINLYGFMTGCQDGWTGHDVFWQNHPATNVPVTHFEVWKSQPIGSANVYGWTVYVPYTPAWVIGADGRMRVKACSGYVCSAISTSFYDVTLSPACNNW